MQLKLRWRVLFWLQEAMAELQAEQKRKALEEEQKLAQERGPILGAMFPPTELQDLQSSVALYSVQ